MTIGEYTGDAEYSYFVSDKDTLLDGPFRFQKSDLEALLEKKDKSFLFQGRFREDYANGKWIFQFGAFESQSESEVVDYQYRVLVSGVQEEASGNILAGKPDGTWNYTVSRIKDSDLEATLFKSTIDFDNGTPQRNFKIENEQSVLVGRFLRDGLAHDEWSLYTDGADAAESWNFEDGLLRSIKIEKKGTSQTVPIFERRPESVVVINLDARYINALQLQRPPTDTMAVFNTRMPMLLSENAAYYKKIDNILSEVGQSAFLPEFKVKVPFYPLDSLERKQMDSIAVLTRKSVAVSDSLLTNSQLNLLRRSDPESSFLYKVLENLSEEFVGPLKKVLAYDNEGILEFVTREQLVSRTWPQGKPSPEIETEADSLQGSRTFTYDPGSDMDFEGSTLASVRRLAEYTSGSLDSIQRILDDKLTVDQREQELVEYERKLVADSELLALRVKTAGDTLPKTHRKALEGLRNRMEKRLGTYSSLKESTSKLERARELALCYEQANLLAANIIALPGQTKEIEELYLDAVWNPFMANVMDEEIKKRITGAYKKVLIPYFLEQASSDIPCDKLGTVVAEMNRTYERMLELRDLSTRKLERKLRREDNPETVMRLMNEPLPTSEE